MRGRELGVRLWTGREVHDPIWLVLRIDSRFIFHGGDVAGRFVMADHFRHLVLHGLPLEVAKLRREHAVLGVGNFRAGIVILESCENLATDDFITVSYTHLDVYKRQPSLCLVGSSIGRRI